MSEAYIPTLYGEPEQAIPVAFLQHTKPIDLVSPAQCWLYIAGNASVINGLEGLWTKHQSQLQQSVENMRNCRHIENDLLVALYVNNDVAVHT